MPKSKNTTPAYNALFQEHEPPSIGKNDRRGGHFMKIDKGQSCHVFAIASAPTWERSNAVNMSYSDVGNARLFDRLQRGLDEPTGEKEVREERMSNMKEILDIRNQQETVLPVDNMYLCGGFREGKMTPEHMWVEDHTNKRSYDTFIDRGGIAVRNSVGVDGGDFQPGCEGHPFDGNGIGRIKVAGYTYGQLIAIAAGTEGYDAVTKKALNPFPDSIAKTPQVLMAIETVKLVNEALAKIPGPVLSESEKRIMKFVQEEQLKKTKETEIKQVITDLTGQNKIDYESAMAKFAEVGRLQRETARAIVGTGFHPFVKLSQDLNAIKPDLIKQSKTLGEATTHKDNLMEEIRKLEEKKGTLPTEEYKAEFQKKIDTLKNQIGAEYLAKTQTAEVVTKIQKAATDYLDWSQKNAQGLRFSFLSHGSYGREQAQKLLTMIANDEPMAKILKVANETVNTSGTNKFSFSRFLHDELAGNKELVGKESLTDKFINYKEKMSTQLNEVTQKEEKDTGMRL